MTLFVFQKKNFEERSKFSIFTVTSDNKGVKLKNFKIKKELLIILKIVFYKTG